MVWNGCINWEENENEADSLFYLLLVIAHPPPIPINYPDRFIANNSNMIGVINLLNFNNFFFLLLMFNFRILTVRFFQLQIGYHLDSFVAWLSFVLHSSWYRYLHRVKNLRKRPHKKQGKEWVIRFIIGTVCISRW